MLFGVAKLDQTRSSYLRNSSTTSGDEQPLSQAAQHEFSSRPSRKIIPMPPTTSADRALGAVLPLIASGQAYEAHQKARTFASRYVKASQYDTAIQVLFQSARELLKAGHLGSGTDLGLFLIDVYNAKEAEVDEETRGKSRHRSRWRST